ncbi:RNA polymerase sigma-70 factor [Roseobacter sp. SK209-2-6]|uniref:RNA polymerase sigma factor SigZ n=1 Tax=Roseobacter sp. SK209-2-6 TaxID=388739 RepID=UPI0000F3CFE5|nr:RNA polymerase sigma-70 factor [Roseobacter sp. SK209-2-6]
MTTEEIWQQYRGRLQGFMRSKLSNPADVEDLLQEVLLKTVTSRDSLKDPAKLQAWLFEIARNSIIDFYRRRGRGQGLASEDLWYQAEEPEVLAGLEACVEPFLAALPEETAAMLRAIDLEGQPQKAYAAEHGLSYSTLKSRVQAGRLALRAVFENCCHLPLDSRGNIRDFRQKSKNCSDC